MLSTRSWVSSISPGTSKSETGTNKKGNCKHDKPASSPLASKHPTQRASSGSGQPWKQIKKRFLSWVLRHLSFKQGRCRHPTKQWRFLPRWSLAACMEECTSANNCPLKQHLPSAKVFGLAGWTSSRQSSDLSTGRGNHIQVASQRWHQVPSWARCLDKQQKKVEKNTCKDYWGEHAKQLSSAPASCSPIQGQVGLWPLVRHLWVWP